MPDLYSLFSPQILPKQLRGWEILKVSKKRAHLDSAAEVCTGEAEPPMAQQVFFCRHPWKRVPGLKVSLPPHQPFCEGRTAHKAAGGWRPGVWGGPSLTTTPCLITSLPWPCVHPAFSGK